MDPGRRCLFGFRPQVREHRVIYPTRRPPRFGPENQSRHGHASLSIVGKLTSGLHPNIVNIGLHAPQPRTSWRPTPCCMHRLSDLTTSPFLGQLCPIASCTASDRHLIKCICRLVGGYEKAVARDMLKHARVYNLDRIRRVKPNTRPSGKSKVNDPTEAVIYSTRSKPQSSEQKHSIGLPRALSNTGHGRCGADRTERMVQLDSGLSQQVPKGPNKKTMVGSRPRRHMRRRPDCLNSAS